MNSKSESLPREDQQGIFAFRATYNEKVLEKWVALETEPIEALPFGARTVPVRSRFSTPAWKNLHGGSVFTACPAVSTPTNVTEKNHIPSEKIHLNPPKKPCKST